MSIRTRSRRACAALALALAAAPLATTGARADDDAGKAQIRDRFRLGMEKYTQGAYKEAIGYWEAIYRELGPREGYRLSFNLARAYEKFSDFTVAAERYEAFLTEIELRRQEGKTIEPIVEKEEKEAKERLEELRTSKGRLKINAARQPVEAKVDDGERRAAGSVWYVSPGGHTIVFFRGNEQLEKRDAQVKAGEVLEIDPPALPEPPAPPPIHTRHEVTHPFSPVVLYIAGAVTVISVIVPVLAYNHAASIKNQHDALLDPNGGTGQLDQARAFESDYSSARTTAYATLAIPLSLAAITGGLTAFYFLGKKEHEIVVRPEVSPAGPSAFGLTISGKL